MKAYDMSNYRRHLKDLGRIKSHDPYDIKTYFKGAFDIAQSFNTEESASGVLNKEDLIQECYTALLEAWKNMDMDAVREADEPQAKAWSYLKKSINLKARQKIHDKKDGIRISHRKRWDITETKNVDDFLTQLFPGEWFAENDEAMDLIDYGYNSRYDIEQLAFAFEDVFREYLTDREEMVLKMSFGVDTDKLSSKNIAKALGITVSNVDKTKFISLQKLRNEEVRNYLQEFYEFE